MSSQIKTLLNRKDVESHRYYICPKQDLSRFGFEFKTLQTAPPFNHAFVSGPPVEKPKWKDTAHENGGMHVCDAIDTFLLQILTLNVTFKLSL
jgi:hypothetical protein